MTLGRAVPLSILDGQTIKTVEHGSLGLMPTLGSYGAKVITTDRCRYILWHSYGELNLTEVKE